MKQNIKNGKISNNLEFIKYIMEAYIKGKNLNENNYDECKYLIVEKEEIKRMGQYTYIKPEPIIHKLCKHPEVKSRRTKFDCEPDKHSWCPYNKEKCSTF